MVEQPLVERRLALSQQKRTDFSREEFVAKVWEWKAQSGGTITRQLRRLGASCDWANERFTMDPGFSRAVTKVFVDLHRDGLIYRDKRLVNWDPGLGTAISDLEVETREVRGSFWHLRYPLADGSGSIDVATTRPETMLADMAVAVHPDDPRYTALVGQQVRLPIIGRLIPIIADAHADPALGSGAVKITPGHDFNDFEVGRRAGIAAGDMLNMLDAKAMVTQTADGLIPADLLGLPVAEARRAVVARLKDAGALIPHVDKDGTEHDAETRTIQTPFGDRSGAVIEPWLTDQWYVDAAKLAGPAIDAVRDGRIKVVPKTWEKTWFQWLENIQPWCVSRQLWWGHQIPAWYDDAGNVFVAEGEDAARAQAGGADLCRDPDVLDTWFSSALWPFATLGWPEGQGQASTGSAKPVVGADVDHPTPDLPELVEGLPSPSLLAKHYPGDVLVSGFDILFFWDARMAMQGLHVMGPERSDPKDKVPWKTLYLHGLVRAADGSKMSKSKGNTVDPLALIDKYGADALRFFMAAMESQGRDIKLDEKRLEGYRNFATKLWNASRFAQTNGIGGGALLPTIVRPVNHWLVAEVQKTVAALELALADLRFDEAANTVYHFVWDRYCDWYLELIKGQIDDETRAVAGWALDRILVMLHPFMPFVTEELWHALAPRDHDLIVADWPLVDARSVNAEEVAEIEWLIRLVGELRGARTELGVPPAAKLPLTIDGANALTEARIDRHFTVLARMARLVSPVRAAPPEGSAQIVVDEATYALPLAGVIDFAAERARLTKSAEAAEKEAAALAARLGNPSFVDRAKPEAVAKARADHAEKSAEATRLRAALSRLG